MENKNKKIINMLPFETERLIIKKTSIYDVELILKMDKQEITQKYLGGIKIKTKEERILFLEKKENKFKEGYAGSLTVCLKDSTPIGFVELNIDEINNEALVSYIFDYDYCNKGYCTEVCKKLLEIGFKELKLDKIHADTIKENKSSKRVLEKLGFKLVGTHKKNDIEFLDYEILLKEYK